VLLAAPAAAAATPSTDASAYAAEVGRVLEQVVAGQAAAAAAEMRAGGLDSSEPEIYRDLNQQPPDLADAEARLRALQAALGAPATGGDPCDATRATSPRPGTASGTGSGIGSLNSWTR